MLMHLISLTQSYLLYCKYSLYCPALFSFMTKHRIKINKFTIICKSHHDLHLIIFVPLKNISI